MKQFITLVACICLLAGDLSAQAKPGGVARQISLGGASFATPRGTGLVFNPFIFNDPSWILNNPAYAGLYNDYLWFNVAGGGVLGANGGENVYGNQFGGFGIGLGGGLTLGATLSYDPSYANDLVGPTGLLRQFIATRSTRPLLVNPAYSALPSGTLGRVETFELVAAFRLTGLTIGGAVSYGWTRKDFTASAAPAPPTITSGEVGGTVFGLRAGAIGDLGGGNTVEGAFAVRFPNAVDKYSVSGTGAGSGNSEYTASATELQGSLRGRMKVSQKINFIPYGAFRSITAKPEENGLLLNQVATTASVERSIFAYAFGGGIEFTSKNIYLAAGLSLAGERSTDETSVGGATPASGMARTSTSAFPVFNIGAEFPLASWLDGRVGYYRAFASTGYKSESSAGTASSSSEGTLFGGSSIVGIGGYGPTPDNSLLTLGLGVKVDAFALDATVSEEALRRGLGLIGASDNINTFGYVTISFTFE